MKLLVHRAPQAPALAPWEPRMNAPQAVVAFSVWGSCSISEGTWTTILGETVPHIHRSSLFGEFARGLKNIQRPLPLAGVQIRLNLEKSEGSMESIWQNLFRPGPFGRVLQGLTPRQPSKASKSLDGIWLCLSQDTRDCLLDGIWLYLSEDTLLEHGQEAI